MRICIVTPAPPGASHGNNITAQRWHGIFQDLGHEVVILREYSGDKCDLLVALHAGKSASVVEQFAGAHPGAPIVVALTGTDLYPDLASSGVNISTLDMAERLVVLQPLAIQQLPMHLRARARVIYQSVAPLAPGAPEPPATDAFDAVLLAHLRPVKDPFRLAEATRLLPPDSRVRVRHLGAARQPEMAQRAKQEMAINPRYHWLGDVPRGEALRILAGSRLMVLTSKHEGGANVISEAIAAAVPVISSRIPGSVGLLGPDYLGYFAPGNTAELACLLREAETDPNLVEVLRQRIVALKPIVDPAGERQRWSSLLAEIT